MNRLDNWFRTIYQKYGEIIRYLIIGVLTTVLSLAIKYALLFTVLDAKNGFALQIAVITSWICSVIFAYVTNRLFVFVSKSKNIIKEIFLFFSSRITTLLFESFILWLFITHLKLDSDGYVILWTLVSQVLVIIGNYILSKFIVFNQKS